MNLWIPSFKSTKLEFSRIFCFRATKGIKHKLHFCQAQPQFQLSQVPAVLGWDSINFDSPPPGKVPWRTFPVCGTILDCWQVAQNHLTNQHLSMHHLSMQHLSVQHLSMQHLSVQHFCIQHLSRDKIRLFTIATSSVRTKQSNLN